MDARRIAAGFAAVAVAVLLGACAQEPGDPGQSPTPPAASPPATPFPPMPSPSPPPGAVQTISGQVVEGVEAGCMLLRTDTDEFLLLGEDVDELRSSQSATVRGYADPGMMTTCQQGTPFMVQEVVSR